MSGRSRRDRTTFLLLGAGPRLAFASVVVALLWAGFFWATTTPGAS